MVASHPTAMKWPVKIWDWCIERGLWLSAVHIPGTMNVKADVLSRRHYSDHEWMLNNDMFFVRFSQVSPLTCLRQF